MQWWSNAQTLISEVWFRIWERGRHWQPKKKKKMCIYVPSLWQCLPSVRLQWVSRTLNLRCLCIKMGQECLSCLLGKKTKYLRSSWNSNRLMNIIYICCSFLIDSVSVSCANRFIPRQPSVFSIPFVLLLQLVFSGWIDNIFVLHKLQT